ncbi:hypothetical protein M2401_006363 [Pseudomonas sp. JUb42]|uniref:phytanoyl-CoA dioxygenase family protein n=1 Tax=Pseudomonas sp. JUb42 TaxID=2940611 RepID=UPI0021694473|nr:phytanoyl-CoA dioxygenase family protein [Pseudomonas sp. JUb42]MCS3472598.1 hypothetical protein [Pseudomonas sp. JUb42]
MNNPERMPFIGNTRIMDKSAKANEEGLIGNQYNEHGYYLAKNLFKIDSFSNIEKLISVVISEHYPCNDIHSPDTAIFLKTNPQTVTKIYEKLQNNARLIDLGRSKPITDIVRLFIKDPSLYLKSVLRIDIPFEYKELAYWHQDDFYVKGNDEELTVWIPLQNTSIPQGCLSVMPGSHRLGRLEHSYVTGKKRVPMGIYDREVRLVEMSQNDALFFSSLLVHSSNLNFSEEIRYSIQLRYTSRGKSPSTIMKGNIDV